MVFVILGILGVVANASFAVDGAAGAWRAIVTAARDIPCLHGASADRVALFRCAAECAPVPWQLDERDAEGEYVLDTGPRAGADGDSGAIDANDELAFMWSDAGGVRPQPLPGEPLCVSELIVEIGREKRRVYAARFAAAAPRSTAHYVEYDVAADRMRGAAVDLSFGGPTPRGLALRRGAAAGRDLLDRLKIRATASFFGVFPLYRDEDHVESFYDAWRVGPIRVIRRERKWVRLGFGFRTPYLRTETTFYRDFALLPVRMRLNFPPGKLLSDIEIRASLDFLNLQGWQLVIPESSVEFTVGRAPPHAVRDLAAETRVSVLALRGGDATIALALRLGPSLQSLKRTVFYSERSSPDGPEEVDGERPGLGFRLSDWDSVDRGVHWFAAESYALPAGYDPAAFTAELALTPVVTVVSE